MSKVDCFVVLDFESGGLDFSLSPATEIGLTVLHPDSLEEISRYSEYIYSDLTMVNDKFKPDVKPANPYQGGYYFEGAFNTTGITIETIQKEGLKVEQIVKGLIEQFQKAKLTKTHWSKPMIVGHNLAFDIPFLQLLFKLAKQDLSKYILGCKDYQGNWFPVFKDTMFMSKERWPKNEVFKLGHCCAEAGIEIFDAHRAINDVVATSDLLRYFLFSMRSTQVGGSSEKQEVKKTRRTFEV